MLAIHDLVSIHDSVINFANHEKIGNEPKSVFVKKFFLKGIFMLIIPQVS